MTEDGIRQGPVVPPSSQQFCSDFVNSDVSSQSAVGQSLHSMPTNRDLPVQSDADLVDKKIPIQLLEDLGIRPRNVGETISRQARPINESGARQRDLTAETTMKQPLVSATTLPKVSIAEGPGPISLHSEYATSSVDQSVQSVAVDAEPDEYRRTQPNVAPHNPSRTADGPLLSLRADYDERNPQARDLRSNAGDSRFGDTSMGAAAGFFPTYGTAPAASAAAAGAAAAGTTGNQAEGPRRETSSEKGAATEDKGKDAGGEGGADIYIKNTGPHGMSEIRIKNGAGLQLANGNLQIGNYNVMNINGPRSSSFAGAASRPRPAAAPRSNAGAATQIVVPNKMVDAKALQTVASHLHGDWRKVGRLLGMADSQLETIAYDYQNQGGVVEVAYQMLNTWKEQAGSEATMQNLAVALVKIKRSNVARLLAADAQKKP